jgi:hypothetical protein
MTAAGFAQSRGLAWALVVAYCLVLNGLGVGSWTAGVDLPAALELILRALAIVVFWKLLEAECAPYRVAFPLDMGFLLVVSNFLLLPYYFWRTQRWRGMAKLAAVVGIWLGTFVLWYVVAWILEGNPAG